MIKLLLYIGILIILCYVLDYFWLKSWQSIRELKEAYKELKKSREDLEDLLK
jgi:hypothetical protein